MVREFMSQAMISKHNDLTEVPECVQMLDAALLRKVEETCPAGAKTALTYYLQVNDGATRPAPLGIAVLGFVFEHLGIKQV